MFRAQIALGVLLFNLLLSVTQATAGQEGAAAAQTVGSASTTEAPVTFAKDVAPIMQRSCQQCHQPGSIGPMSFRTYDEVRPWARSIKQRVVSGEMPPYHYDRGVGIQKLQGDKRLTDAEIRTI